MPSFSPRVKAWAARWASRLRRLCGFSRLWAFLAAALVVSVALLAFPPFEHIGAPTNLVGSLFGNRVVVGAVHVVALAAGAYIVASIAALIVEGRWINEIGSGGAKVDAAVAGTAESIKALKHELTEAKGEKEKYGLLAEEAAKLTQRTVRAAALIAEERDTAIRERNALQATLNNQTPPPPPLAPPPSGTSEK